MRRGSSKPLVITVSGEDLSLFEDIWVMFKQDKYILTKKMADLTIEGKTITVPLTEAETAKFEAGTAFCQIKYKYGGVDGTEIKKINVKDIIDANIMGA